MNFDSMIKNYNDTMRLFNDSQYGKPKKNTNKSDTNVVGNENYFKHLLEHEMSCINNTPKSSIIDYSA